MLKRSHKRIARTAMMWLMVAMFAMPTSLVPICPCTTVAGESQCGCGALVTECDSTQGSDCCHNSRAQQSSEIAAERECGISLFGCHCDEHSPCQCQCDQRNEQAINSGDQIVVRQATERVTALSATLLPSSNFNGSSMRTQPSPLTHAKTAQQRCATLSRFLI
ncbi:hypothetical protein [Rhodopirellula europaea]|uniref:hypothetical protein n=1 Tax=Rhodopirellula europaea TaxID=1263866 RepID=UPI003D274E6C